MRDPRKDPREKDELRSGGDEYRVEEFTESGLVVYRRRLNSQWGSLRYLGIYEWRRRMADAEVLHVAG